MPTRGEAQAALDDFIERTNGQTVAQYVADGAAKLSGFVADIMMPMYGRLELLSEVEGQGEVALLLAQGLYEIADVTQKLGDLAVGTAAELGGDATTVGQSPAWAEYVTSQQALVDSLPDTDEETEAILADADAMAAIEEAEAEVNDGEEVSATTE